MSVSAVKEKAGKILSLYGGSIPDREYLQLKAFAEENGVDERQLQYQILPDLINSFNVEAFNRKREEADSKANAYIDKNLKDRSELNPIEVERFISFAYDIDIPRNEALQMLRGTGFEFGEGDVKGFRSYKCFARSFDRAHGFSQSQLRRDANEESLFELNVLSPTEAEFQVYGKSKALKFAVEDVESFFSVGCNFKGIPERGATVKTVANGILKLNEGVWEVVRKAEISFGETPIPTVQKAEEPVKEANSESQPAKTQGSVTSSETKKSPDKKTEATTVSPKTIAPTKQGSRTVGVLIVLFFIILVAILISYLSNYNFSELFSPAKPIPLIEFSTDKLCDYRASSERAPLVTNRKKYEYDVSKIHDGDVTTAWVEGTSGLGIGEWIELNFSKLGNLGICEQGAGSPCVYLVGFDIYNGLGTNNWDRNGRVTKIKFEKNGDSHGIYTVADTRNTSVRFDLDYPILPNDVIRLTIVSSVQGREDNDRDVCISELIPIFKMSEQQRSAIVNLESSTDELDAQVGTNEGPAQAQGQAFTSTMPPIEIIRDYFAKQDSRELGKVMSFWSNRPKRYWDIVYPTHAEIEDKYQQAWNAMRSSKNFVLDANEIGVNQFEVRTRFEFVQKNGQYKSDLATIILSLNDNGKIISEYKKEDGTSEVARKDTPVENQSPSGSNDKIVQMLGGIPSNIAGGLVNVPSFNGWKYPEINRSKINAYRMMTDRKAFFVELDLDEDGDADFCARIFIGGKEKLVFGLRNKEGFKYSQITMDEACDYIRVVEKGSTINDIQLSSAGVAFGVFNSTLGEGVAYYEYGDIMVKHP